MKKTKIYAAYGSNLNHAQMRERCPEAKYLGSAMLKNQNLLFCGQPNHSFATIKTMEGKEAPIGLWEISARDERALDRYEGYPNFYHKTVLPVTLDGEEVHAMVYIMDLAMPAGLPSVMYYDIVEKGYRDCGLDTAYLKEALKTSMERVYGLTPTQEMSPGMEML